MDKEQIEEFFQQSTRRYYRMGMVMGLITGILFGLGIGFMIGYHLGSGNVIVIPLDQGIKT
jgi:F0F1-type ATP synthase assembly protein I